MRALAPYGGSALSESEVEDYEIRAIHEGWFHRDAVAFDQFLNVLALHGAPDETMSAHFQRLADSGNKFGKFMIWWLDKVQPEHGQRAQAGDLERAETVEDTEAGSLGTKAG